MLRRLIRHVARTRTLPAVPAALHRLRTSDTLFVLASGSSILRIHRWDEVAAHDSLGFNYWLLHPFVPDYYMIEAPRVEADRAYLLRNLRRVSQAYHDVVFFNKQRSGSRDVQDVLDSCGYRSHPLVPIPFGAGTIEDLRRAARALRASTLRQRLAFYCQGVATVELAVLFGWSLGYERIVLCGVDLNHTGYFFHDPDFAHLAEGDHLPPNRQSGSAHKTNDPDRAWGGIPVADVLSVYQEEILKQGCRILVESEQSALASRFPIHSLRD